MLSEPTLRQPRQLSTSADRAHPTYGRGNGSRNNSIDDDHVASSRRYIRGRVHVQAHDPTGIRLSPLFVSYARNIGAGTPTIVSASWKQRYTAISCVPDGVEEAFGVTPQQDLNQEKLPPRHACRPLGRQLGSPPRRQAFSVELKLTVFAEASAIPCAPREEKRRVRQPRTEACRRADDSVSRASCSGFFRPPSRRPCLRVERVARCSRRPCI